VGAEVINRVTGLPYTANLPGRAKEMTDNDLLTELQIHMALMNAYGAISGELSAEAAREWVRIILAAQRQKLVDEGWMSPAGVVAMIRMRQDEVEQARIDERQSLRAKVAIEYNKCIREAEANPFPSEVLNHEHMILWRGHANAYSEVMSHLDALLEGERPE
jgi:hypothetical protein